MNRVCPNVRHENITFVVVQMAIEMYSLPVSTANGIKFCFQFYQNVKTETWNLFIYSVGPTRSYM